MKLKCSDGGLFIGGIDDLIRCYALKLIPYRLLIPFLR